MTDDPYASLLDAAVAGTVAASASLQSIQCIAIEARHFAWPAVESLGFEILPTAPAWARVGSSINAIFSFELDIHSTDSQGVKTSFVKVGASYRITYRIPADVPLADVRHFVGVSGLMHLWPYLRAEVQYLTTQIGLPPLLLPLLLSGHAGEFIRIGAPQPSVGEVVQVTAPPLGSGVDSG